MLSKCLTLKQKKKERKKETVLLPETREFRGSILRQSLRQCVCNIFESVTKKVKPRRITVLPTEQCRKRCTLLDIVCAFRGTLHLQIFYKYVVHVRENPQFSDKAIFNIIYESSWSLKEDGDIKTGEPCQS